MWLDDLFYYSIHRNPFCQNTFDLNQISVGCFYLPLSLIFLCLYYLFLLSLLSLLFYLYFCLYSYFYFCFCFCICLLNHLYPYYWIYLYFCCFWMIVSFGNPLLHLHNLSPILSSCFIIDLIFSYTGFMYGFFKLL